MDGTADFSGATFLSRNNPKDTFLVCRIKGVGVNPCPGRKQRRGNIHAIAFNGGERVLLSLRERDRVGLWNAGHWDGNGGRGGGGFLLVIGTCVG
jgi:hypothetical protein